MSANNYNKLARQPPNEAAVVVALGGQIRLTRWGIAVVICAALLVAGLAVATISLVLAWATPEEAIRLVEVIKGFF